MRVVGMEQMNKKTVDKETVKQLEFDMVMMKMEAVQLLADLN